MNTLEMVVTNVVKVKPDLSPDWLSAGSQMRAELGFSSIDLINLLALITQTTNKRIMYESLFLLDGQPRAELTLGELADFVDANMGAAAPRVVAM